MFRRGPHLCVERALRGNVCLVQERGSARVSQGHYFQIVSERPLVTRLAVGSSRSRTSLCRESRSARSETPSEPSVSPLYTGTAIQTVPRAYSSRSVTAGATGEESSRRS